jgi:hypothetical protein
MYVAIFAAVGLAVGWYACKAWIAHGDVGGTVRKISGLKRARTHNGGIAFLLFIAAFVVLYALTAGHK